MLDHANKIKAYRMKDIQVRILDKENKILFVKNHRMFNVNIDDLNRNPSSVSGKLNELIQSS